MRDPDARRDGEVYPEWVVYDDHEDRAVRRLRLVDVLALVVVAVLARESRLGLWIAAACIVSACVAIATLGLAVLAVLALLN